MRSRKDPERGREFWALRLSVGLPVRDVAELLEVSRETVRNWERGTHRTPYAAFRLLRVLRAYELPHEAWQGWIAKGGALYSPAGQRFDPYGLGWLSLTFRRAEAFGKAQRELHALRASTASVALSQGPGPAGALQAPAPGDPLAGGARSGGGEAQRVLARHQAPLLHFAPRPAPLTDCRCSETLNNALQVATVESQEISDEA